MKIMELCDILSIERREGKKMIKEKGTKKNNKEKKKKMTKLPITVINHQSDIRTNKLCQKKDVGRSWGHPWGCTKEAKNARILRLGPVMYFSFREGVEMARVTIFQSSCMLQHQK